MSGPLARQILASIRLDGSDGATGLVDEEIRTNPNICPPKEVTAKLFPATPRDDASVRIVTRAGIRFAAGDVL